MAEDQKKRGGSDRDGANGSPPGEKISGTRQAKKRKSRKKPEYDPETMRLTVGQLIGIRRRALGWTQETLADKCGLSRTQIGRIERDESDPLVGSIERLEVALGVELYALFMEQKRERARLQEKQEGTRLSWDTLSKFGEDLSQSGISEDDLRDVLDEALRSAELRSKGKK